MDQPTAPPSSPRNVLRRTASPNNVTPKRGATVRLSEAGRKRIEERAERCDVRFSHMVRRMLAYADRHMPEGWVPPQTSGPGGER